jgi:hypothetical protein
MEFADDQAARAKNKIEENWYRGHAFWFHERDQSALKKDRCYTPKSISRVMLEPNLFSHARKM